MKVIQDGVMFCLICCDVVEFIREVVCCALLEMFVQVREGVRVRCVVKEVRGEGGGVVGLLLLRKL